MPAEKVCPRCRRRWLVSAPFCQGCGHRFSAPYARQGQGGRASAGPPPAPPRGGHPGYGFHIPPPSAPPPPAPAPSAPAPAAPTRPHGGAHLLIVLVLALVFPWAGLGQLYNGQFAKIGLIWGLQLALLAGIFHVSGLALGSDASPFAAAGGILLAVELFLVPAACVLDAICIATKICRGRAVGEWDWF